jgi:hypothetical protein
VEFVIHDKEDDDYQGILQNRWQSIKQNIDLATLKKQEDADRALALKLQRELENEAGEEEEEKYEELPPEVEQLD